MPSHSRIKRLAMAISLFSFTGCTGGSGSDFPSLHGSWLGQAPPGDTPALFAPGVVSTGMTNRDIAVTPDGREICWCVIGPDYTWSAIVMSRRVNGRWLEPRVLPFTMTPGSFAIEPHISADGQHLWYASNDPAGPSSRRSRRATRGRERARPIRSKPGPRLDVEPATRTSRRGAGLAGRGTARS